MRGYNPLIRVAVYTMRPSKINCTFYNSFAKTPSFKGQEKGLKRTISNQFFQRLFKQAVSLTMSEYHSRIETST